MNMTQMMRWGGNGLLLMIAGTILLIASGWLDPKPVGDLQWEQPLTSLTIPSQQQQLQVMAQSLPDQFSLRLTAAWHNGEIDSGYGLFLCDQETLIVIAIAPTGYATVFQQPANPLACSKIGEQAIPNAQFLDRNSLYILPWQTWPHIRMETASNELWIDVIGHSMRIWINREFFWEGPLGFEPERMGIYGMSFGETAVIDFQAIRFYTRDSEK